jgi:glycosyltransferase involved in cell wall biosynthesis
VVAETDPPLLCFVGAILKWWRRAKLVCYVQDLYPDLAVALGKIPPGWPARWLRKAMIRVYRNADRVIVPGHDMRRVLVAAGVPADAVICIPNWIDTRHVVPVKQGNAFREAHGLDSQFIVMYSGNLGWCQPLDDVVRAANRLRDRGDILFTIVGDGVSKRRLQQTVARMGLANIRFFPYQAESGLGESLSAADLHLVPVDPRVASYLMPSKLYGVLASESAVMAIAPEDCETARVVRDGGVGFVVAPGRPDALAEAIRRAAENRAELRAMGRCARRLAQSEYDRRTMTRRFGELLGELASPGARQPLGKGQTGSRPRDGEIN